VLKRLFYVIAIVISLSLVSCEKEKGDVYREPTFKGIVYIQGHNDHVVAINLENSNVGWIPLGKKAEAISLSEDGKVLYVLSMDGFIRMIDLVSGERSGWVSASKNICASAFGPEGNLWFLDRNESKLYVYDVKRAMVIKDRPVIEGTCGITFGQKGRKVFLTNSLSADVMVLDVDTLKMIETIENAGNSIHGAEVYLTGKELWIAEGNEYKDGRPYGVGYAKTTEAMPGGVNVVDLDRKKMVDFIFVGGNVMDLKFSSDGRFAFLSVSQMPDYDEATLAVVDVSKRRVIKKYRICDACHNWKNVEINDGKALVGEIEIDLGARSFGKAIKIIKDMPVIQEGDTMYTG
jgi:DNA-binding beta-propeller fold protein YncE